jgi:lysophospholipase L1-like esterase
MNRRPGDLEMKTEARAPVFSALCLSLLLSAACGKSASPQSGSDAGPDSDPGTGVDAGTGSDAAGDDGAAPDTGGGPVAVTLGETEFTFPTPDVAHTLTASVTGTATTTVTWASSNTYIATVSAAGVVTSVSGGQATITATSTADTTKTATCAVTVAEPNRARAASYVDAKSITSGPIKIIMAGDSLTRTYAANTADQTGWGQVMAQFLTTDATVDNTLSNGGRSSRSFYNEVGRWDQVKARLMTAKTAGTPAFVFIMFGHNDQKKTTDTDGPLYLTFASNNQNGTVAGTYYDYLERYIVETRDLGGIPILFTPFVREYLAGTPPTVTIEGQHDITAPYTGETAARGDYPAAARAIAAKHDVPIVDITAWSKTMVDAHAATSTLPYVYIADDQTHIRQLGALLIAQEAVRALNAQGILTAYAKPAVAPRVMMDANAIAFGGIYAGNSLDKSFKISAFKDVTGTITITAPANYAVSTNGTDFGPTAAITCDSSFVGGVVSVRFAPTDSVTYNAALTVAHSSLTPDYGNTVANATAGTVSLTGNGKVAIAGTPATATWPMFSGTAISLTATADGAITPTTATLTGLVNKNVAFSAARFDTPDGTWPAESARNPDRYVQFTIPVTTGSFTLDTVSVGGGTGGGSNTRWDIVYSLSADFGAPTALGTSLNGAKDTLVTNAYQSLGVPVAAGQTLYLRVYPYNTGGATSGKTLMLANVVISGVTN